MELDSFRAAWQRQHMGVVANLPDKEIMESVQQRLVYFHKMIRRRDRFEIGAAILGAVFFAFLFVVENNALSRIGSGIIVAGSALIVLKLKLAHQDRHHSKAQLNLAEYLEAERERVQAQIRLLRSVPLWYLGPILLGANLFVAGFRSFFPEAFGFLVVSLLLSAFIYWLNLQAVRHQLLPMRCELDSLIGELEPNGDQSVNVQ